MNRTDALAVLVGGSLAILLACGDVEEGAVPEPEELPEVVAAFGSEASALTGVVRYVGPDLDVPLEMAEDPLCRELQKSAAMTEAILVNEKGQLENVFVYVKNGLEGMTFPVPEGAHLLDQRACRYRPHVSGMLVGQKLVVRNSDPTLHNVRAMPGNNPAFNHPQPFDGMEMETVFGQPEVMIPFVSDAHPWMKAFVGVLPHPFFAVSNSLGVFRIEGMPPGVYELEAWHEELGVRSAEVEINADNVSIVAFDFSPDSDAIP